jgi:hypothetical protein
MVVSGFPGFISSSSGILNSSPINLGASLYNYEAVRLGMYINTIDSLLG